MARNIWSAGRKVYHTATVPTKNSRGEIFFTSVTEIVTFWSTKFVKNCSFDFAGRANKKRGDDVVERNSGYPESVVAEEEHLRFSLNCSTSSQRHICFTCHSRWLRLGSPQYSFFAPWSPQNACELFKLGDFMYFVLLLQFNFVFNPYPANVDNMASSYQG